MIFAVRLAYTEQFGKNKFRKNRVVLLLSALLSNFICWLFLGLQTLKRYNFW